MLKTGSLNEQLIESIERFHPDQKLMEAPPFNEGNFTTKFMETFEF